MRYFILLVIVLVSPCVFAADASDFSGLEGWTIAAVTEVSGEFEGCDYDKRIHFDNGWTLTCDEYEYEYDYSPDAVIFVKGVNYQGHSFWSVKALIEDELYDMEPIIER